MSVLAVQNFTEKPIQTSEPPPRQQSFNQQSDIYVTIFIYLSPNGWFICSSSKTKAFLYRETGKLI